MYRALYEYKSALPDYLSFRAGDQFTIIDKLNKDWFKAQNGMGQIGNVPCNYVTPVQVLCLLWIILNFIHSNLFPFFLFVLRCLTWG